MTCGYDESTYAFASNETLSGLTLIAKQGNALNKTQLTQVAELTALSSGPSCSIGENATYLAHMNTPNVVRDFDLVRNLTGYDVLSYWGYSYGSILGTMYAQMFPDRVGRMVIDGNPLEGVIPDNRCGRLQHVD